jgi:hypothetical protein
VVGARTTLTPMRPSPLLRKPPRLTGGACVTSGRSALTASAAATWCKQMSYSAATGLNSEHLVGIQ